MYKKHIDSHQTRLMKELENKKRNRYTSPLGKLTRCNSSLEMRGRNVAPAKKTASKQKTSTKAEVKPNSRSSSKKPIKEKRVILKTPQKPKPEKTSRRDNPKEASRSRSKRTTMRYAIPPASNRKVAPAPAGRHQTQHPIRNPNQPSSRSISSKINRRSPMQRLSPNPNPNAPRSRSISSKISQGNNPKSRSERPSNKSISTPHKPHKANQRKARISAPASGYKPLLQTFTPDKMREVIVEEAVTPMDSPVRDIVVPVEMIPVVPDEYEGIPRAKIMIPIRRPFGFTQ